MSWPAVNFLLNIVQLGLLAIVVWAVVRAIYIGNKQ